MEKFNGNKYHNIIRNRKTETRRFERYLNMTIIPNACLSDGFKRSVIISIRKTPYEVTVYQC